MVMPWPPKRPPTNHDGVGADAALDVGHVGAFPAGSVMRWAVVRAPTARSVAARAAAAKGGTSVR